MILGSVFMSGLFSYELPDLTAAWAIGYISDMPDDEYNAWVEAGQPSIQRWITMYLYTGKSVKI